MSGLVNARPPDLAAAVAATVVFVRNRALLLKSADIAAPYLSR
jgi:hypothetical protein